MELELLMPLVSFSQKEINYEEINNSNLNWDRLSNLMFFSGGTG